MNTVWPRSGFPASLPHPARHSVPSHPPCRTPLSRFTFSLSLRPWWRTSTAWPLPPIGAWVATQGFVSRSYTRPARETESGSRRGPTQDRIVTDWRFTSGCSPRTAAVAFGYGSVNTDPTGTFTLLCGGLHRRPMVAVPATESFSNSWCLIIIEAPETMDVSAPGDGRARAPAKATTQRGESPRRVHVH
jgi:hypothetical protein